MFKTRLLSGILLIIVALVTIISGGPILFITLLIVSLIGMSELYKILGIQNKLLGAIGYCTAIVYYGMIYMGKGDFFTLLSICFLILVMMVYVFAFPTYQSNQVMMTYFGVYYVAVMLSYVYQTRMLHQETTTQGMYLVWLVFISSWGCDTCAYCVGMLLGKHKMAPKLSPKKSIEGGIGGVVGAALLGALYALIINLIVGTSDISIASYALICGIGGMISQVGDLSASAIKRNHEIKDYGKLIPGHGGILDRFDSVIFTAPVIYYLSVFLLK